MTSVVSVCANSWSNSHVFALTYMFNVIGGQCNASVARLLVSLIQHSLRLQTRKISSNPEAIVTELKPGVIQLLSEYMAVHFKKYWVCPYYRY